MHMLTGKVSVLSIYLYPAILCKKFIEFTLNHGFTQVVKYLKRTRREYFKCILNKINIEPFC